MAVYAIGDVQGCDTELGTLLQRINFSADRDRLWFVGDLVNRGPGSLQALRRIRALGDAATVTLGNHDLHLLAVAFGHAKLRADDTLDAILSAPDREALLAWLIARPLLHEDIPLNLCLLHAGLPPQWDVPTARACAREFEHALRHDPRQVFEQLYGDEPTLWDASLRGADRLRYIANCFTRLRYVDAQGRLALRAKGSPEKAQKKIPDTLVRRPAGPLARTADRLRALVNARVLQQCPRHGPRHRLCLGRQPYRVAPRSGRRRSRAGRLRHLQQPLRNQRSR